MAFERKIEEVRERNGNMPQTTLHGYNYQWIDNDELTDEENQKAHNWIVDEINRLLPDYATWYESMSEITIPIDKVDGFDLDWEGVLNKAMDNYLKVEDEVLCGESR